MVNILKEFLLFTILISPVLIFLIIYMIDRINNELKNCKIYKFYYEKIDDMIFYHNVIKIPFSINSINSLPYIEINYFETQWKVVIKNGLTSYDIKYGANPFKNYWYNKIVDKISKKNIYSYMDFIKNKDYILKMEERDKKLNKILKSWS